MTQQKSQGGRPSYQPTDKERAQVKALAGMGVPDYEIAKVLQVSPPTMRKYYAHELDIGHIEANAKVAQSLFKQATDPVKPNVTAAIFWLKTRARWTEATPDDVGKKEQTQANAETADRGTAWQSLLQ